MTKRKRVIISTENKLNTIKRVEKDEILQKVVDDYLVGHVTIGDCIERNRLKNSVQPQDQSKERQTMRKYDYKKVSKSLYIVKNKT